MMKRVAVICMYAGLTVVLHAGTWLDTRWDIDPLTDLASSGTLIKASNFGQTAQAVTFGGINFDLDYSNTDAVINDFQWADRDYYSGSDTAAANLMNKSGAHHYAWGNPTLTINVDNLIVGNQYRIQIITGGRGGSGVDFYSTGWSDYKYDWASGSMLNTFVWTADASSKPFYIGANGWTSFDVLGYAVHEIPEPATMVLFGLGALILCRKK